MTHYIVTSGEYSDYHFLAVFDSEDKAQAWIALFLGESERARVEEIQFNPETPTIAPGLSLWRVEMTVDGEVRSCQEFERSEYRVNDALGITEPRIFDRLITYSGREQKIEDIQNIDSYCFARDKEHAVKITNERRTRMIAEGRWILPAEENS